MRPYGAFYIFPCIKEFGMTSEEFATKLLEEEKVAVVPGTAFGDCGEGFLRISYAYSLENLKIALERLERFIQKLRGGKGRIIKRENSKRKTERIPTMAKLNVVLFQPEIPSNTGNIGRTCVATGTRLHLIEPLGFRLNEKEIRRAGMDYWEDLDVTRYVNYEDFLDKNPNARIYMATTKGKNVYNGSFL